MASDLGPARADELDAVRALLREYRAYIHDLCGFWAFEDADLAALPGAYRLFVIRRNDVVIGCAAWRHWSAGVAEMKRLYVSPAARGTGDGRRVVLKIIADVRRAGYSSLRLDTLAGMTGAIALYRSLGFEPIAAYHDEPLPDAHYFELPLD